MIEERHPGRNQRPQTRNSVLTLFTSRAHLANQSSRQTRRGSDEGGFRKEWILVVQVRNERWSGKSWRVLLALVRPCQRDFHRKPHDKDAARGEEFLEGSATPVGVA